MYLGIEIGGTKLQVGAGPDDGKLRGLWRGTVDRDTGPAGIRTQLQAAIPQLLAQCRVERTALRGVGIGFGGPVDDATRTIITSHQIAGWNGFPLADWVSESVGLPAVLGNDADVAGLAEALHGAGKGLSPVFYVTIGSGIGGGLIVDGEIYRGCGRGAAELGHLPVFVGCTAAGRPSYQSLERAASGWALSHNAEKAEQAATDGPGAGLGDPPTPHTIGRAAESGNPVAQRILNDAWEQLAEGLCHVITLLCPRRIVIGGGVSLLGERLLFEPLRHLVAERTFKPFGGLTDIVPAALGEEVVVHGAIALARKKIH